MTKMKNYAIVSGKFTANGNFTGYDALGERVHVHKNQMNSAGWKEDKDLTGKFPFYVIATVKQITPFDEEGKPKTNADGSPALVDRLTASSVFTSKEGLTNARVDVLTLDIEIAQAVKASATKAGLTETDIKQLAVF